MTTKKRLIRPPAEFKAIQSKDSIGLYFTDHGGVEAKIVRKLRDGKPVTRGWSNPNEYIVELYIHKFKTWMSSNRRKACRCGRIRCDVDWLSYTTIQKDKLYEVLVDTLLDQFKGILNSAHQAAAIQHWAHVNK